ncbi:hypothetical protein HRG_014547 [Hirsutella rhossiliensis]
MKDTQSGPTSPLESAEWAEDLEAAAVEISQKWHSPTIATKSARPSSSVQTASDHIALMTPNALPALSAFMAWYGV